MKKLIALVLTLMFTLTAVAALAEAPATTDTPSRTLVVYYSATGSTERIANMIAEETGADVFVITPVEPYTDEDLNWTNDNSRVVYEHDHPEAQNEVALTEITPENWDNYDTVYIGYRLVAGQPFRHRQRLHRQGCDSLLHLRQLRSGPERHAAG